MTNAECRMTNGGVASLSHFKLGRIHCSMLGVGCSTFISFFSDQIDCPLAGGIALMKLHIFKTTQIKVKGLWEWPPATITHPGNRG
ncbi:hypothetical protein D1AOALGA4SA_11339 [Olavius algarvensis Delta 1 endosymbiont]|nr:hypothetical protein D1AOALGA4SA_11339 [Olavius algarvensis Delta 1 endosymbiont]